MRTTNVEMSKFGRFVVVNLLVIPTPQHHAEYPHGYIRRWAALDRVLLTLKIAP